MNGRDQYVRKRRSGTTIRIIADGPDEEAAVKGLVDLVDSGFAEGAR